jgi:hypothetical protein
MSRNPTSALALVASWLIAIPAAAQSGAESTSNSAQRLFEQGLSEMKARNYEAGCPRLAKSHALEPSLGALFTLAECEAAWGKSASALSHYQSFVAALPAMAVERREAFEERRRIATEQISSLGSSVPRLVISVASELPPTLVVKSAGAVVPRQAYGVARPVDPGNYDVTAELDGEVVWQRSVLLQSASEATLEITRSLSTSRVGSKSRSHLPEYLAGGVAVAGFVTGAVAGLLALEQRTVIERHCPARICDPQGRAALGSGRADAWVSTVGTSIGIVGAVTAASILIFSPTDALASSSPSAAAAKPRWAVSSDGRTIAIVSQF